MAISIRIHRDIFRGVKREIWEIGEESEPLT